MKVDPAAQSRPAACAPPPSPAPTPPAPDRTITTSGFTPIGARRWSASSSCRRRANEQREKLEQLRALDAGMRIDVAVVKSVPLGVDTPEELKKARKMLDG